MMVDREDLGLSLSLNFPEKSSNSSSPPPFSIIHNPSWVEAFTSSDRMRSQSCGVETRPFLKGIDVNCLPASEEDGVGAVSSPNSTISSISGKRSEREGSGSGSEENDVVERACSRDGGSDEEDGENSRKKLRLSKDQSAILEESFKEHNTLNPKQKTSLAKRLGLRPRQVEVWFQNRRARTKLKQTEVDCEFLKRCCEKLSDENRRLQKEVQELRALRLSPQTLYMQMNTPPTTLTICPSCEKVAPPPPPPQLLQMAAQPRPRIRLMPYAPDLDCSFYTSR